MKLVDFKRPPNLQEACDLLRKLGPQAIPIAGATSLVFMSGNELKVGVDINRVGLSGIARENGSFRIGSTTRIAELQEFADEGWVLNRVAVELASQQIRNMSTLGGNIARVFPWADFPVALLALGAFAIIGDGARERQIPANEFFGGQPMRLLQPGELVVRIEVPAVGSDTGFGYRKIKLKATGFSLITAAAWLKVEGPRIIEVRVALGGGVPFPARANEIEAALAQRVICESDLREVARQGLQNFKFREAEGMSATYIGELAAVVAGDVLVEAYAAAKERKS